MKKENLKLELLNNEESNQIRGGDAGVCTKTGDTIWCIGKTDVVCCTTIEVACRPNFTSDCGIVKFTISGCNVVIFS